MTQTHDTIRKDSELGPIPQEWEVCRFGDISINLDSKRKPVSTMERQGKQKIYPYYGASGIVDYIDDFLLDGKYLLISEDGENLNTRNTPISFFATGKFWVNNHAHVILNNEKSDLDFLKYRFDNCDIAPYVNGAVQPKLNKTNLENIEIPLPPLHEQHAIASVLGSLDDKIEVLREQNRTLEKMGKEIFKSWFVDFDFPGANGFMIESEIGLIPKGWRVGKVEDIAVVTSGKRPNSKSDKLEGDCQIPILGAGGVMGYTTDILFDRHLIVMGRVGTHGQISRVNYPCRPSDNTLIVQSKYFEYMYQIICGIDFSSLNKGAVQPLITQTDIKNYLVIIPNDEILNEFENTNGELFEKVYINNLEIENLIKTRDSLLPRLMSGKVRVF